MRSRLPIADCRLPKGWVTLWLSFVFLVVQAVAQEELPKLQPPLGEIPPTFWEQYGTTVMVSVPIAMLLLALGIWLLLRPKPVAVMPPEVEARTALEALRQRPEDGAVVSRASQVLRRYVLAAFEFPRVEPTTTEFCQLIVREERVGAELAEALATFLRQCDERKFAQSNSATTIGAVARAVELVDLSESRSAQWRQQIVGQSAQPTGVSA